MHSLESVLELLGERKLIPDLCVVVDLASIDVKDMLLDKELSLFDVQLLVLNLISIA